MTQFLVIGHDAADSRERRLALRDQHVALARELQAAGNLLYGAAILDDRAEMCGSMLVAEFESRAGIDEWFSREPYITGKVWESVEVTPCRVGPMFR